MQLNAGIFWTLIVFATFGVGYIFAAFVDHYNRRKRRIRKTSRTLKTLSDNMQYISTQYASLNRKVIDVEREMQDFKTQMAEMAASIELAEEGAGEGADLNAAHESRTEKE